MWNDVIIAIPTMPERRWMLSQLLAFIGPGCSGAEIVVREHEGGASPREDLPRLMDLAVVKTRRWILVLEDDVWPASSFGTMALEAIEEADRRGARAITLFSRAKEDVAMLNRKERFRQQAPSAFCMMQAVAVLCEAMQGFAAWAPSWYERHPEHCHAADLLLGAWLSRQKAKMLVHVPSLVQHRSGPSTLPGGRAKVRQSDTYTMAFGNVP
jgi:hypothetical protein